MIGLGEFFKKVQNSFLKEVSLRTAIRDIIKKYTEADVSIENISYKNNIIILKDVSQTVRSVIFIKKQAILKEISEKQDIYKITDIR
ncbi:MAG: hypothetical protein WC666_04520 [Candidatus Paceibacterota bacterium]|jgi:hypothetical protein